jgi:outer membrane scaffolding protein for murein synthesis (MipA/OmpV family)
MNRLSLAIAAILLMASPALCQEQNPDGGWSINLGAVGRVRPAHLGSDHYIVDSAPVLEASYGDHLTISFDDGVRWTVGKVGPLTFGPIAEYRQSFNDQLPRGAFKMDDAIEIGGFSQLATPVGLIDARLRHAVNGYDGWSGDVAFDTGGNVTPKLQIGGQVRVSWADSNFTQEYFGLRPHAARKFGLPQFLDEDYITAGGEFDVARVMTPHTQLVLALSADRMLSGLPASPLFNSRNIFVASLGVTYHWSNSAVRTPR